MKRVYFFYLASAVFSFCLGSGSATAQELIKDRNGGTFMQEVPAQTQTGQEIRAEDGSLFMQEEIDPRKKKKETRRLPPPDFESLGVPLDPKGRIIPLIQPGAGPVMNNYSRLEMEYTPPAVYVPYWNYRPYTYTPTYPGYGFGPFRSQAYPGYTGWGPYFAYPLGIPRYYSSSSDDPSSQNLDFQSSTDFRAGLGASGVWSPNWRSPFRGNIWLGPDIHTDSNAGIRSFFPKDMNQ